MRALLTALVVVFATAATAAHADAGAGGAGAAGIGAPARTSTVHHHRHHAHRRAPHRRRPRWVNPLHSRAMWIWELNLTSRGDLPSIIAEAHRYRVTTLIIKSSDGVDLWSQFTPALVSALHRAHLKVCAWQYVYGARPGVEANLGADAVHDGADCLVIDAETEYQGRYVAAQAYIHDLRKQIGGAYPLALAGFPYVDYHPGFPYSVFLGPHGAQSDVPQMYWRAIGESVSAVFAHTYAYNLPYGRRIYPLGQVYDNPPMRQVVAFRRQAIAYGAGGVSWWDWQEARALDWSAVSTATGAAPRAVRAPLMGAVGRGARGDLVVWIQEHLITAGQPSTVDGVFGPHTAAAVRAFQAAHRLPVDGIVGPETWAALLRYRATAVHWVRTGRRTIADALPRAAATGGAPLVEPVPLSASRPARRDEIPGTLGAGRPRG